MKRIALFILYVFTLSGLFADYGAAVKVELDAAGQDEAEVIGNIIIAPWYSVPFDKSELYISAGINTSFGDRSYFAPELFRLEYSFWRSDMISFRVGRMSWQDTSGFIARGRFDGADAQFDLGSIRLGANLLYTGFLFRETAYVNVSPQDTKDYGETLKWSEFGDTYFAPRRLLASVYGQFPGLPFGRGQLYAGLLVQFDLSGADEAFHTQYLTLRHTLVFGAFDVEAAGAVELENTDAEGTRAALAFFVEGGYQLPFAMKDRLSLGLGWASGDGNGLAAFFPITLEAQSFVLRPAFSGIMLIRANYHARILSSLSADLGAHYFFRTDSDSFSAAYLKNDSYALGMELNTSAVWVPFSDLLVSLKGGVFMPKTGAAWEKDAPVMWRITVGAGFYF